MGQSLATHAAHAKLPATPHAMGGAATRGRREEADGAWIGRAVSSPAWPCPSRQREHWLWETEIGPPTPAAGPGHASLGAVIENLKSLLSAITDIGGCPSVMLSLMPRQITTEAQATIGGAQPAMPSRHAHAPQEVREVGAATPPPPAHIFFLPGQSPHLSATPPQITYTSSLSPCPRSSSFFFTEGGPGLPFLSLHETREAPSPARSRSFSVSSGAFSATHAFHA